MAKVLLVDDSSLARRSTRKILEDAGHQAVEAQDGQPRRECAQPRAHRASAGQYSPDGFYPKPIVEIADDDSAGVFDEFGDGTRLRLALMDRKAEMGGNHGDLSRWETDAGSDRSAGLTFLIRDI